jgi:hypothetical protein
MNAICLVYRANPSNACLKEYSVDGGETWQTMWNDALCLAKSGVGLSDLASHGESLQQIIDDRDIYDGDITNIYENWLYGDSNDQYRDAAQCWIAMVLVKTACDLAVAAAQQSIPETIWDCVKAVGAGIEYGYAVFMALEEVAPGDWATLPAVVVALGKSAWGIYNILKGTDVSAFSDSDARDEVVCAIFGQIFGKTPGFAAWSTSLDGFTGSEHAEAIADVIKLLLADEDTFMELYARFGDAIVLAENGVDFGCPCNIEWYYALDLTESPSLPSWLDVPHGSFVFGQGIVHADWSANERWYRSVYLGVTLPNPAVVVRFQVTFDRTWGTKWYNTNNNANGEGIDDVFEYDIRSLAQSGTNKTEDVIAPAATRDGTSCFLHSSYWTSYHYSGSVKVTKLEFWGTGANPFTT